MSRASGDNDAPGLYGTRGLFWATGRAKARAWGSAVALAQPPEWEPLNHRSGSLSHKGPYVQEIACVIHAMQMDSPRMVK